MAEVFLRSMESGELGVAAGGMPDTEDCHFGVVGGDAIKRVACGVTDRRKGGRKATANGFQQGLKSCSRRSA